MQLQSFVSEWKDENLQIIFINKVLTFQIELEHANQIFFERFQEYINIEQLNFLTLKVDIKDSIIDERDILLI